MDKINDAIQTTKGKSYHQRQDEILLEPYRYICQIAGKGIRSAFCKALDHWLNVPKEKLDLIIDIVHILHNSSLILDDIQDNSILRRGIPVANSIYGVPRTLHVAIYVFCLALDKVQLLVHPESTKVFAEQLLELHRGQGMEIYWRDSFTVPSELDFKLMAVQKSGGLFLLSLRLMQLFSENKKDLRRLIAIVALYFQIIDDYSNLCVQEYIDDKGFCDDLSEGKYSFPIVHALRAEQRNEEVLSIVKQRTQDVELKKYCVSLLENDGSLQYTRDVVQALYKEAMDEIARLGPNPLMEQFVNEMGSSVLQL